MKNSKLFGFGDVIGGVRLTAVEIQRFLLGTVLNANSMHSIYEFGYVI